MVHIGVGVELLVIYVIFVDSIMSLGLHGPPSSKRCPSVVVSEGRDHPRHLQTILQARDLLVDLVQLLGDLQEVKFVVVGLGVGEELAGEEVGQAEGDASLFVVAAAETCWEMEGFGFSLCLTQSSPDDSTKKSHPKHMLIQKERNLKKGTTTSKNKNV